jgi:hypothetical protein
MEYMIQCFGVIGRSAENAIRTKQFIPDFENSFTGKIKIRFSSIVFDADYFFQ